MKTFVTARLCRVETRTRFEIMAENVLHQIELTQDSEGYAVRRQQAMEGLLTIARVVAAEKTTEMTETV